MRLGEVQVEVEVEVEFIIVTSFAAMDPCTGVPY